MVRVRQYKSTSNVGIEFNAEQIGLFKEKEDPFLIEIDVKTAETLLYMLREALNDPKGDWH